MGSLSPRWRRPSLSGDRAGRDGQKWGASCHDNWWGLLIGQGTREQAKHLFAPPWWKYLPEYAHPGTHYKPTEHFGSFTCTVLPLPRFLNCPWSATVATYPPWPIHMHDPMITDNPPKQCCIYKMRNQFEATEVYKMCGVDGVENVITLVYK